MSENDHQLRMVLPEQLLCKPPQIQIPLGYSLRTYLPGDETRFYQVMSISGWQGWNDEKLQPWVARILPDGWFMIVDDAHNQIVATAMALRDVSEFGSQGGELGWLASDLAHAGKGLGLAVCAAVIARFIREGYRHIHLYTEHYRLAALKTYFKLGFVPYLDQPEMLERWSVVCDQLGWQFAPEQWKQ
jgi:mycothiol synthase